MPGPHPICGFHRRLVDRVRRQNARDRSLQIAPPCDDNCRADTAGPVSTKRAKRAPRVLARLNNQFGPRNDDADLAKHTEKLLGKEVPLPKLVNQKVEYARWKSKVTLWFPTFKLDTHDRERYDSALSYTSMKYHTWYNTRRVMAFTVMALYLGMFLRDLLKGDGVNPDYILRNLLNHDLKLGQTVEAYVAKSEELERRLRQAKCEIEEREHARMLISKSQRVFRELVEQHTLWCSKNDRRLGCDSSTSTSRASLHAGGQLAAPGNGATRSTGELRE
ncbi:hypothetical protein PF011_g6729 [Phytophthora fragariae]|uniref:Uncharacterized protein n=1 Tax=Phytophthora fragariae TaxID=53985 RepID=A0A6A3LMJ4_9STRA|nr:hypothetical protein PF011_g6729 [Phytophthora fragariae]